MYPPRAARMYENPYSILHFKGFHTDRRFFRNGIPAEYYIRGIVDKCNYTILCLQRSGGLATHCCPGCQRFSSWKHLKNKISRDSFETLNIDQYTDDKILRKT